LVSVFTSTAPLEVNS